MNRVLAYLPIGLAVVAIVGVAIVQGGWTARWGARPVSEQVKEFSSRIDQIPIVIGDWEGEDDNVDTATMEVAGAEGWIARTYTNKRTQESASVMLVCGDRRNMTTHTPERCYKAAGFTMGAAVAQPYSVMMDDKEGNEQSVEFLTARFKKETNTRPIELRILWAWASEPEWQAPRSDPRFGLSTDPAWYKLYLISNEPEHGLGQEFELEEAPAIKFAKVFMPIATPALFPSAGESTTSEDGSSVETEEEPVIPSVEELPPA